jgi:hypothetical protein
MPWQIYSNSYQQTHCRTHLLCYGFLSVLPFQIDYVQYPMSQDLIVFVSEDNQMTSGKTSDYYNPLVQLSGMHT